MSYDAGVGPDVVDPEGSHQWDYPPTDRYIRDAHQIATWLAEDRLRRELSRLRGQGVDADGEVVAANPVEQIRDLTTKETFDEVVVSTLPRTLSAGCGSTCRTGWPGRCPYR